MFWFSIEMRYRLNKSNMYHVFYLNLCFLWGNFAIYGCFDCNKFPYNVAKCVDVKLKPGYDKSTLNGLMASFTSHFLCCAQDSGGDGAHLQGHHPPSNNTHRGGWNLPLCVNQWWPKLSLEGHLWGGMSAVGVSPAAGQGQCHPADASFR